MLTFLIKSSFLVIIQLFILVPVALYLSIVEQILELCVFILLAFIEAAKHGNSVLMGISNRIDHLFTKWKNKAGY